MSTPKVIAGSCSKESSQVFQSASIPSNHTTKITSKIATQETQDIVTALREVKIDEGSSYTIVDTPTGIVDLVEALINLPTAPPSLYVDLEGVKLSRHGSISIIQIYVLPQDHTYLIDVHVLGKAAFSVKSKNHRTLKGILESAGIPKVFFDVRNGSDALFSHFGIDLKGVYDLQLMELATRNFSRTHVHGLVKCIERHVTMSATELRIWKDIKERSLNLFEPKRGGSYEAFNQRPLSSDIVEYCIQDVRLLPRLWNIYHPKLTQLWAVRVEHEVNNRITASQSATYQPDGKHKALGPQEWTFYSRSFELVL